MIYYHIRALHTMRVENRNSLNGWKPVKAHTHTLSTENTKPRTERIFFISKINLYVFCQYWSVYCTLTDSYNCAPPRITFTLWDHAHHLKWVSVGVRTIIIIFSEFCTQTHANIDFYTLPVASEVLTRRVCVCVLSIQLFLKAIAAHTAIRSHYYASCTRTLYKNSAKQ